MTIEAKIILDSVSPTGHRITTLQLVYPRFVHAEFLTHRVFSRNASSSRAIPVAKVIEQVRKNPAMPIHWGKNQPGMQAYEQLEEPDLSFVKSNWLQAARCAADFAEEMANANAHKQVVNRILEPYQHIHVIVTATEWSNFFALRDHEAAQPEIRALAVAMHEAMDESMAKGLNKVEYGDWHLPYIQAAERKKFDLEVLRKLSAARCARVSYLTHDGKTPSPDKDLELYDRLVGSVPLHASPIEHQATPNMIGSIAGVTSWANNPALHGNFVGWIQYRKLVEGSLQ